MSGGEGFEPSRRRATPSDFRDFTEVAICRGICCRAPVGAPTRVGATNESPRTGSRREADPRGDGRYARGVYDEEQVPAGRGCIGISRGLSLHRRGPTAGDLATYESLR